jgi:hypothetical protein
MSRLRHLFIVLIFGLAGSGCSPSAPELPDEQALGQAMADLLIDTGFYQEVAMTRKIGNHYAPGSNTWTLLRCYRFTGTNGAQGENCVDSFVARQMDTMRWVVGVTIEGVYRWRAISPVTLPDNQPLEKNSDK